MPQLLYITTSVEDYLSDSLLHGLRSLYGADVVDYPKCEFLYKNCPPTSRQRVRGNGFTLYTGLLDDIGIDRTHIEDRLRRGVFDWVVFGDIWRQFGTYVQLLPWLDPRRTALVDGADSPRLYPYAGLWYRKPYYLKLPRVSPESLYFKREWTPQSRAGYYQELVPTSLRGWLPAPVNLRPIAFSIPEQKIVTGPPEKTQLFPAHIVDPELARLLPGAATSYAFSNERDYYADLQRSRFGITTKRAGWDCLRHYEIAANGAVPCFRDFLAKPVTSAPHGLSRSNCVFYRDAADLLQQTSEMSPEHYAELQANAIAWAHANSTVARARAFLAALESSSS
ncbi:MAG: hypothetical protein JWN04_2697 [Myxococcaceae bacterium]|nr:hypothetical protein [Myxococcaceae bacterium]